MKSIFLVVLSIFTWDVFAMDESTDLINQLIKKDNYALELWEPRGLNPSPSDVILSLENTTNNFLKSLRKIHSNKDLDNEQKKAQIQTLVDLLPWLDYDTEEREFLADTIAPAIRSVGFDPWSII